MDLPKYPTCRSCFGLLFLLIALVPVWGQDAQSASPVPGDNSRINQQDRNSSQPTADQQSNNRSDLNITKEIRRSLVKDNSLSTYAHNVKVIAQDGKVTLKGPVRSDDEKSAVVAKAAQVVGPSNVSDEMTVVPKHD
jgi:hyperosmotically inducible periplasmic protein